jgi:hypothetical protein
MMLAWGINPSAMLCFCVLLEIWLSFEARQETSLVNRVLCGTLRQTEVSWASMRRLSGLRERYTSRNLGWRDYLWCTCDKTRFDLTVFALCERLSILMISNQLVIANCQSVWSLSRVWWSTFGHGFWPVQLSENHRCVLESATSLFRTNVGLLRKVFSHQKSNVLFGVKSKGVTWSTQRLDESFPRELTKHQMKYLRSPCFGRPMWSNSCKRLFDHVSSTFSNS